MGFRTIIQIDHQGPDVRVSLPHRFPPADQTIDDTVARHLGGDPIEKQVVGLRNQQADRRHGCDWGKIVITGLGWHTTPPAPAKRANIDRRLRIDRDAQLIWRGICVRVYLREVGENSVGFWDLFWGWLLATCRSTKPNSFSLTRIVSTVGSSLSV